MLTISCLFLLQADSDGEEKVGDSSRETLDQSCEHAKEQLTNSIRQQWRKLRNHMEKLDNQGTQYCYKPWTFFLSINLLGNCEAVPVSVYRHLLDLEG